MRYYRGLFAPHLCMLTVPLRATENAINDRIVKTPSGVISIVCWQSGSDWEMVVFDSQFFLLSIFSIILSTSKSLSPSHMQALCKS